MDFWNVATFTYKYKIHNGKYLIISFDVVSLLIVSFLNINLPVIYVEGWSKPICNN